MEHIRNTFIAFLAAVLLYFFPVAGDSGSTQLATALVMWVIGWLSRSPLHPAPVPEVKK